MRQPHAGRVLNKSLNGIPSDYRARVDPALRQRLKESGPSLRCGDLVLFGGWGWLSATIRVFTRSRWSHVAMVVRLPAFEEPLLIEANSMGEVDDFFAGQPVPGVTLVSFYERVARYPGQVALRRRGRPLSPIARARFIRRVCHYYRRPYKNFLVSQALDLLCGLERPRTGPGVFCSELVAELCRHMGWLAQPARTSRFVPAHFHDAGPRAAAFAKADFGPLEWITASDAPADDTAAIDSGTVVRERLLPRQLHGGP